MLIISQGFSNIPWRFFRYDIIDPKSLAILHANLSWESDFARHAEAFYSPLKFWREHELLPDSLVLVNCHEVQTAKLTSLID